MVKYKYKETDIEWLGKIPKHWKASRIKSISKILKTGATPTTSKSEYFEDGTLPWYGPESFNGFMELSTPKKLLNVSAIEDNEIRLFYKNSVFVVGIGATIGKVGIINEESSCNQQINVITPYEWYEGKFVAYFLKIFENEIIKFSQFTTLPIFNQNQLGRLPLSLPPLPEQKAIADYLDKACQRIDKIIDIKQKQLENLQGIRKAKIYHAVTVGINPVSEWKELKFNQIKEIPANWKLYRIKSIGKVKYGLGQPPNEMIGGLPIIRATNVYRGKIDTNNLLFVDPDDVPYERDPVLRKDDIIVVRSGAYTADSAIIPQEFDGSITGYDMVLRCNKNISAKFVAYALLSKYILDDQLLLLSLRAAQPHLNREELGNSRILLPDFNEQKLIAEHLDVVTEKIDKTIQNIKNQITTLQSYRKSLIHECVTGKKQVWDGIIEKVS